MNTIQTSPIHELLRVVLGGLVAGGLFFSTPIAAQSVNALEGPVETNVLADQSATIQFAPALRATRADQPLRMVVPLIDSASDAGRRPPVQVRLADIVPAQQPGTGNRISIEVITLESGTRAVELRSDTPISGLKRIGLVVVWGNSYIKRLYNFDPEALAAAAQAQVPARPLIASLPPVERLPAIELASVAAPVQDTPRPPAQASLPPLPAPILAEAPASAPTPSPGSTADVVAADAPPAASVAPNLVVSEAVPVPGPIVLEPLAPWTPAPLAQAVTAANVTTSEPSGAGSPVSAQADTPAMADKPVAASIGPLALAPTAAPATLPVVPRIRSQAPRPVSSSPTLRVRPARDSLKLDRAQTPSRKSAVLETAQKMAMAEAQSRASELADQVLKLRQLLSLQDQKIAAAQLRLQNQPGEVAALSREGPASTNTAAPVATSVGGAVPETPAKPTYLNAPAVVPTVVPDLKPEPAWQRYGLAVGLGMVCVAALLLMVLRRRRKKDQEMFTTLMRGGEPSLLKGETTLMRAGSTLMQARDTSAYRS